MFKTPSSRIPDPSSFIWQNGEGQARKVVFVDRTSYAGVARLGPGLPTDRGRARAGGGQPWRAATLTERGGGNPGNSKGNARAALAGATPLVGATPARARALPASGAHIWHKKPCPATKQRFIEKDDEASPAREEDEAVAEKVHNS